MQAELSVMPTGTPRLGEHHREVWCGLVGLIETELDELRSVGVV